MDEPDLHIQLILQIFPETKLIITVHPAAGTVTDISDRQDRPLFISGRRIWQQQCQ